MTFARPLNPGTRGCLRGETAPVEWANRKGAFESLPTPGNFPRASPDESHHRASAEFDDRAWGFSFFLFLVQMTCAFNAKFQTAITPTIYEALLCPWGRRP